MNSNDLKQFEIKTLKQIFGDSDIYLTSQYDPADIVLEGTSYVIIGEYKTRFFSSTDYKETGWILEVEKAKKLLLKTKQFSNKTTKVLYINFFIQDEKVCIWDIKDIIRNKKYTKDTKKMNKQSATDFKDYNKKVNKNVLYLKIEDCLIYK